MKFVIYFIEGIHDAGGYFTGKTFMHQGSTYAVCEEVFIDKAKKYTSKARAENAAEKIHNKATNVNKWEVREIQ